MNSYQYENLDLGGSMISVDMIILAIFIGGVIASFAAVYNKRMLGGFVRALIKAGANTPETAKTIGELGFGEDPFVRSALRGENALRRTVVLAEVARLDGADAKTAEKRGRSNKKEKINFETARFYIPEQRRARAEIRYDNKGTGLVALLFSVLAFAVIAAIVYFILPDLLEMLDTLIADIKPEKNYI